MITCTHCKHPIKPGGDDWEYAVVQGKPLHQDCVESFVVSKILNSADDSIYISDVTWHEIPLDDVPAAPPGDWWTRVKKRLGL